MITISDITAKKELIFNYIIAFDDFREFNIRVDVSFFVNFFICFQYFVLAVVYACKAKFTVI